MVLLGESVEEDMCEHRQALACFFWLFFALGVAYCLHVCLLAFILMSFLKSVVSFLF